MNCGHHHEQGDSICNFLLIIAGLMLLIHGLSVRSGWFTIAGAAMVAISFMIYREREELLGYYGLKREEDNESLQASKK